MSNINGSRRNAVTRGFIIWVSIWVSKVLKSLMKSMFICVLQNRYSPVQIWVVPPKNSKSKDLEFFLSIAKAMAYHQLALRVVSHQSVRTVYHHALACIKKCFRNDDIQNFALMICNFFEIDDIQCFALISNRFYVIICLKRK